MIKFAYTTIDVPGAIKTHARGINDAGQIVGDFDFGDSIGSHGFLKAGDNFTTIDPPQSSFPHTHLSAINNLGQILGTFTDTNGHHAFLLDGGSFRLLDGASDDPFSPLGINDTGGIVGNFLQERRGFLMDGTAFTTIDVSGALETGAFGINNAGQIVGDFTAADHSAHGFLKDEDLFTSIDVPGAYGTGANGINNAGQIVGGFASPSGRGFLRTRVIFSTIEVPGSISSNALGINNVGQIVGEYATTVDCTHGFVASFYIPWWWKLLEYILSLWSRLRLPRTAMTL